MSVLPIPLLLLAQIVVLHDGVLFRRSDGVVVQRTSCGATLPLDLVIGTRVVLHSLTSAATHGTHGIVASALTHGIVASALGAQKEGRYSVLLRGRVGGAQTNNMTGFYQHHEYLTRFLVKFNDYYYCICFGLISAASAAMATEMDPLFGVSPHLAADRVDQLVSCRIDPYVSVVVSYIL